MACMISARAILPSRDRLGASHASGNVVSGGEALRFVGDPSCAPLGKLDVVGTATRLGQRAFFVDLRSRRESGERYIDSYRLPFHTLTHHRRVMIS